MEEEGFDALSATAPRALNILINFLLVALVPTPQLNNSRSPGRILNKDKMSLASGLHRGSTVHGHRPSSRPAAGLGYSGLNPSSSLWRARAVSNRPSRARLAPIHAGGQWQTFGPSASHMDGDAEYYQLSNRLAQQIPGFAPTSSIQGEDLASTSEQDIEEEVKQELRRTRPEFGLTPRQISALGLSGPRLHVPDSVSVSV